MPWTWSTLTYLCDLFPTQHRRSAGPASIFVSIRQISKALAFPRSFAAPSINSWRQWWNHPRQLQLNHLLCFTFLTQKPKVEIRWNTHVSERVISPSPLSRNSSGSLGTSRNIVASIQCGLILSWPGNSTARPRFAHRTISENPPHGMKWYEPCWQTAGLTIRKKLHEHVKMKPVGRVPIFHRSWTVFLKSDATLSEAMKKKPLGITPLTATDDCIFVGVATCFKTNNAELYEVLILQIKQFRSKSYSRNGLRCLHLKCVEKLAYCTSKNNRCECVLTRSPEVW